MNDKEAKARIKINKLLEESGWRFFDSEYGPANIALEPNVKIKQSDIDSFGDDFEKTKNGFVDYLLLDEHSNPLIVLEAKKEGLNPLIAKEQARKYANSLRAKYIILSNGEIHYFWNLSKGNPEIITAFPTYDSLKESKALNSSTNILINMNVDKYFVALSQDPSLENNHPAIIEPEIFEMVRIEKDRRLMLNGKYSGTDILTSRIKCGECGGSYGAKVWHSSSKYKKVIYQCNRKYAGKEKCKTPAIRADDVETRFVNAVNSIIENKDEIISNLEMVLDKICNKKEFSEEKEKLEKSLAEQVEKIQELIDMNSRVAQNQEKYKKEYDAMIKTYDETKFKYEQLEIESSQQAAKHQMIKDYINTLKKQNKPLTKFDGLMWGSLLESATIKDKDTIVFKFKDGTEING